MIVTLVLTGSPENPDYVIEFPDWLLDDYGLPDWVSFSLSETLFMLMEKSYY